MTRIRLLDVDTTTGGVKAALEGVARKRGYVPSPLQVMAHSPSTLQGYLAFAAALASGSIDFPTRERIAIAVSNANDCQPCVAAHKQIGRTAGLPPQEGEAAANFRSADPRADAVLSFTRAVMETRGHVTDAQFEAARSAGLSDIDMVEIAGNIVLNQLTNLVNSIARVPVTPPAR